VSIISVMLSSGIASLSLRENRINTKLAQRAYLGYKVEPVPNQRPGNLSQYRVMLTNFGNTPADAILVRPVDFLNPQPTRKAQNAHSPYDTTPYNDPTPETSPSLFGLGPKETVAVEVIGPDSRRPVPFSGYILYLDVFGVFHKQSYCVVPRLDPQITDNTTGKLKPPTDHFEDCDELGAARGEEDISVSGNDEAISREYFPDGYGSMFIKAPKDLRPLRPRCGIEGLQDCSH
jgi:hypothetical protein